MEESGKEEDIDNSIYHQIKHDNEELCKINLFLTI
jgi:hypothetical protein